MKVRRVMGRALVWLFVLHSVFAHVRAHACWDGPEITVGRVSLAFSLPEAGGWNLEQAYTLARLASQIEALLPPGRVLSLGPYGGLQLCEGTLRSSRRCIERDFGDGAPTPERTRALFDAVVRWVRASPRQVARARRRHPRFYALISGSFTAAGRAQRRVDDLNGRAARSWPFERGVYRTEGAPSDPQPAATFPVVRGTHTFHRVYLGVFTSLRRASGAARALSSAGYPTTVVRLR